jgi:putative ABC transport system permease protein
MSRLTTDLQIAARTLLRRPTFALLAVSTLALGVGAVASVFSIVDAVLLRPYSFREPERLVSVWEVQKSQGDAPWRVAPAAYVDWSRERSTFEQLAAFSAYGVTLTGRGEPLAVRGAAVTANYFETLGAPPLFGRTLGPGDLAGDRTVVLGHGLWRERFGANPEIVGDTVSLDGKAFTVVGVMPPGVYPSWPVNGPRIHFQSDYHDLWVLLPSDRFTNRISHVLGVVGRLAPGVELAGARAAMDLVAARLAAEYPEHENEGVLVRPFAEEAVGDVRQALALLLGAAALVLLVACANVGGLVAARATDRRTELAVRRALGAGSLPLARQFFAEGLLLAVAGAAAGAGLAAAGLGTLKRLVPQEIPRLAEATVDPRAIAVAAGAALVASLTFALVPFALPARAALAEALRDGGRGGAGLTRQRLRAALTVTQVALAVTLSIFAALLVESFRRLEQVDPGVTARGVLIANLSLPSVRYTDRASVDRFYRDLVELAGTAPGVEAAHIAYDHPYESHWLDAFSLRGRERRKETPWTSELAFISSGHARRFLGAGSPLGATLESGVGSWSWGDEVPTQFEIVGVAEDVRRPGFDDSVAPAYYLSARQIPQRDMKLIATISVEPGAALAAIRERLRDLDRDLPLGAVRTLELVHRQAVAQPRFNMQLMSLFGALALTLAAIGIYGLLAAWVAGRRREIGVRLSLGADRSAVVGLVLRRGMVLSTIGVAVGVATALAVSRLLASHLYAVSTTDPGIYLIAPAVVLTVALAAGLTPAWRAARVDPAIALRED